MAVREVEDWGFEAEESVPPALPAAVIHVATEDKGAQPPNEPVRESEPSGRPQRAATLAILTVVAASVLIWVSGIVLLIWWAVGALFG